MERESTVFQSEKPSALRWPPRATTASTTVATTGSACTFMPSDLPREAPGRGRSKAGKLTGIKDRQCARKIL